MRGGFGDDLYLVDNIADVATEDLSAGNDRVIATISYTLLTNNIEGLTLDGAFAFNGTGNNASNDIVGNSNNNILSGLDGHDRLTGMDGNDKLIGGVGSDFLDGGKGADVMDGGIGSDLYVIDNISDTVIESANVAGEIDTVRSELSYVLGIGLEDLNLLGGNTHINGTGNSNNNRIVGNFGNNILSGLDGNDSLFGLSGNDRLVGGNGNDFLNGDVGDDILNGNDQNDSLFGDIGSDVLDGGNGNDSLNGGLGFDVLNGGMGSDRFDFDTALGSNNIDTVRDFNPAEDAFYLNSNIFSALLGLPVSAENFKIGVNPIATDANDYLLFQTGTGRLFYDADGNGISGAVQFASVVLVGATPLSASDFFVYAPVE